MLSLVTPDSRMSSQCEVAGGFLESENPLSAHMKSVRVGEKLTDFTRKLAGASQAIWVSF
jgi:hypothetical protein